jgi:membrane protein required for beta-lactamase induction
LDPILENLVNYGVLGLWTASLLWSNHTARKNFQSRYDNLNKDLAEGVKEVRRLLDFVIIRMASVESALDKVEDEQKSFNAKALTALKENKTVIGQRARSIQDMIQAKNQEDMLKSQIRRVITNEKI